MSAIAVQVADDLLPLLRGEYTNEDIICALDTSADDPNEWQKLLDMNVLKTPDKNGQSFAYRIAANFFKFSDTTQALLLSSPFVSVECMSLEGKISERGNSIRSVAGNLLIQNSQSAPMLIQTISAFRHPTVFLSGRHSNFMVINALASFMSYRECCEYFKPANFNDYLNYQNTYGLMPAFQFAKDPEFLSTGLHLTPGIYNAKTKSGHRIANYMKNENLFGDQPITKVAEWIAEFAVLKLPFPCAKSTDIDTSTVRYITNLIGDELSLLGEQALTLRSVATLHACISMCGSGKVRPEALSLIDDLLNGLLSDSTQINVAEINAELEKASSFPGVDHVRTVMARLLNNLTFQASCLDPEHVTSTDDLPDPGSLDTFY